MTLRRIVLVLLTLTLAICAGPVFAAESGKKKGPAKKKAYDYERSKYKSRELTDNTQHTYRFNEKGEPVVPGLKKNASSKSRKRSETPAEEIKSQPEACGPAENCAEKKTGPEDL